MRVEAANELTRYMTLQRKLVDSRIRLEKELMEIPGRISNLTDKIAQCKDDAEYYAAWKRANPPATDSKLKKSEAEKRKALREYIAESLAGYVLETKEKLLMSYRGFDIILPANMIKEKPNIRLSRQGKYYVELGDTEIGNLVRIDNFLDSLDEHLKKLNDNLNGLQKRKADIEAELAKEESYSEQIEEYRKKVEQLDKQLGVNKV